MPSPFPGMDPWLEFPGIWPGLHDTLVIKTVEVMQPQLRSRGYYASSGERVWVSQVDRDMGPDVVVVRHPGRPTRESHDTTAVIEVDEPIRVAHAEVEFHEGFVEIYYATTHELVTSIEYLSPTNKTNPEGRRLYQQKQAELRAAGVHLVEIDLLRRSPHVLDVPLHVVESLKPWDYVVNIVRRNGTEHEVYPIRLRDRLPRIRIPLKSDDADAVLELQEVFTRAYDIGPYPERCNYSEPPIPPLPLADAAWADGILRPAGLRDRAIP